MLKINYSHPTKQSSDNTLRTKIVVIAFQKIQLWQSPRILIITYGLEHLAADLTGWILLPEHLRTLIPIPLTQIHCLIMKYFLCLLTDRELFGLVRILV